MIKNHEGLKAIEKKGPNNETRGLLTRASSSNDLHMINTCKFRWLALYEVQTDVDVQSLQTNEVQSFFLLENSWHCRRLVCVFFFGKKVGSMAEGFFEFNLYFLKKVDIAEGLFDLRFQKVEELLPKLSSLSARHEDLRKSYLPSRL